MPEPKATWTETNIAGLVFEPGCAAEYKTGAWRTSRPVHHMDKCTHCLLCWVYCPDSAIIVKDGRWVAFDYDHCKGCGICGAVCPVKVEAHEHTGKPGEVIQMVLEGE
jgi:2-oxoacid:acceptor oxidoreductase delta subunit (pyruvate/2-ketoisovalerate family)